ncbi:hypothetical protein ACLKA7_002614 [Drosophila subpalustris]
MYAKKFSQDSLAKLTKQPSDPAPRVVTNGYRPSDSELPENQDKQRKSGGVERKIHASFGICSSFRSAVGTKFNLGSTTTTITARKTHKSFDSQSTYCPPLL